MDTVRLQQIRDRHTAYTATSSAGIDLALARRICDALGQQTVFMNRPTLQRLARQLAIEFHPVDFQALLNDAINRNSTHT